MMKICDFGFSKRLDNKKMKNKTVVGTPLYMSLQILKSEPYTGKCDIWALGFIFYEVIIFLSRCYMELHLGPRSQNMN